MFGYEPHAYPGGLKRHEYAFLNKGSSYEKGATMLGVGQPNHPGIDAIDITNGKAISLKNAANINRVDSPTAEQLKMKQQETKQRETAYGPLT